jgi:hypothetical protein
MELRETQEPSPARKEQEQTAQQSQAQGNKKGERQQQDGQRNERVPNPKLAPWDQDGSALTDIIDAEEKCPQNDIKDDPEAVAQIERMRGLQEPEEMEDFGLCPVSALA